MSSSSEVSDGREATAIGSELDRLREQVSRLEARVARERRARIEAEEITETATARLYESNQDLEAFVANAAHDLRTPVIALQGFAGLLARTLGDDADETVAMVLDRMTANTMFLSEVLNDLLELAAASGERAPAITRDPGAIVALVIADLEQRYPGVQVEAGDIPPIAMGSGDLRRVLTNLIGNAVAYGGEGVRVSVDGETEGGFVHLRVTDDGVGIPASDRDRIFEPFVRGAGNDRSTGTGLGLSISRRICRQYGGNLRLVATATGASFEATLPAPG